MSPDSTIITCDPFGTQSAPLDASVLAIGIFDGLHAGHRTLFAQARAKAEELGVPFAIVTFERDPDEIFRAGDGAFTKLLSNEERLYMLSEQADLVLVLPSTKEVFGMSPDAFLDYLMELAHPRAIFTGSNFRYGAKAAGTKESLAVWAQAHDCAYTARELVEEEGDVISSTRIRRYLAKGRVSAAKHLLAGRPHAIYGTVVHGRGQGDSFGFATANLDISACEAMLPREGVYGAYALVDGKRYPAAVNVGVAKSFSEATAPIEAHLLDFSGSLYGKEMRIEFEEWLREPRVFSSNEELIETVMGNINWVRENLGGE